MYRVLAAAMMSIMLSVAYCGEVTIYAVCDNVFEMKLNGKEILNSYPSKPVYYNYFRKTTVQFNDGDLITVKAMDCGHDVGFSCIMIDSSNNVVSITGQDSKWKTYDPKDEKNWSDLTGTTFAEVSTGTDVNWKNQLSGLFNQDVGSIWNNNNKFIPLTNPDMSTGAQLIVVNAEGLKWPVIRTAYFVYGPPAGTSVETVVPTTVTKEITKIKDDNGHGNDVDRIDPSNPGKKYDEKTEIKSNTAKSKVKNENGHGNEADHIDTSNPGKKYDEKTSTTKKIEPVKEKTDEPVLITINDVKVCVEGLTKSQINKLIEANKKSDGKKK